MDAPGLAAIPSTTYSQSPGTELLRTGYMMFGRKRNVRSEVQEKISNIRYYAP